MPIATSLASVLLTASALTSTPLASSLPPITVTVAVTADISPSLVARVLGEAGEIWRAAGFLLMWERQPAPSEREGVRRVEALALSERDAMRVEGRAPSGLQAVRRVVGPAGLHVTIGNDGGKTRTDPNVMALGWIVFEAGSPLQEIYLSHANALNLLAASNGVIGRIAMLTIAERETLMSRAMGRALAHEIGHYLLASKTHTTSGLMKARRSAAELFSPSRGGFRVLADQKQLIAARLQAIPPVALAGPWEIR